METVEPDVTEHSVVHLFPLSTVTLILDPSYNLTSTIIFFRETGKLIKPTQISSFRDIYSLALK